MVGALFVYAAALVALLIGATALAVGYYLKNRLAKLILFVAGLVLIAGPTILILVLLLSGLFSD